MSDDKLLGMVQTARAEATVQHFPDLVHLGTRQALFETKTWSQVQFKCNSSEPQVQFYSSKWLVFFSPQIHLVIALPSSLCQQLIIVKISVNLASGPSTSDQALVIEFEMLSMGTLPG